MENNSYKESIRTLAKQIQIDTNELKLNTCLQLIRAADVLKRYLDLNLPEKPVSQTGFAVLHSVILNGGSMKPTDIAKTIFRSKNAVTKVVDTLESDGLVKRVSGENRRTIRVKITKRGLEYIKRTEPVVEKLTKSRVFETLTEKEIVKLNRLLKRVKKHSYSLILELED